MLTPSSREHIPLYHPPNTARFERSIYLLRRIDLDGKEKCIIPFFCIFVFSSPSFSQPRNPESLFSATSLLHLAPCSPQQEMAVAIYSYLLLFSLIIRASIQQTCFWPDGSSADGSTHKCPTYVYSTSDLANVPCCIGPDTCLTNGLCLSGYGNTYRGGCTSKDWNGCPDYCTKGWL
jgi:hypothetical protein